MSSDEDTKPTPKLARRADHSLFVRNLSPDITEQLLRSVFNHDVIEKITFRAYPNSNNQFFAQIDFASSTGVTEGSKLSGVPILGVPIEVGVIDPIVSEGRRASSVVGNAGSSGDDPAAPDAINLEEVNRRITEAAEDQRMRTVHISGLPSGTTTEKLERLCLKFGEIERLRVDTDANGDCFGLAEFKERGPAHIAKTQRIFKVDGAKLIVTEAKSLVEEASFMEQTIHFQAPIVDAMAMRDVIYQQGDLREKLDKVRQAAMSILRKDSQEESLPSVEVPKSPSPEEEEAKAKDKSKLKQQKAEKREKKIKKKMEKKQKKKEKKQMKKKMKRKSRGDDGEGEEEEHAVDISESPDGPVDLDSEVEMVGRELVMLASNSSSSSSSDSEEDRAERIAKAAARRRAEKLSMQTIVGDWHVVDERPDLWSIDVEGQLHFNQRKLKADTWQFAQETKGKAKIIYCKGQRAAGWELDLKCSNINRLIWKKEGEVDTHWLRKGAKQTKASGQAAKWRRV